MIARFESSLRGRVTLPLLDDLYGLPVEKRIAWLRVKVDEGRSALFHFHLARNLWIMAAARERTLAQSAPDPLLHELVRAGAAAADPVEDTLGRTLRQEAVRQALLTYVAMRVNAPLCRDRTSPDSYLHQLGNDLQPMLAYLSELSPEERAALIKETLRREARLDLAARPDDLICRRGIYGDRYCPPGGLPGSCPDGAAPYSEFMPEEVVQPHRLAMRRKARLEIEALAR